MTNWLIVQSADLVHVCDRCTVHTIDSIPQLFLCISVCIALYYITIKSWLYKFAALPVVWYILTTDRFLSFVLYADKLSPQNCPFSCGGGGPDVIHCVQRSPHPNDILIGSSGLAQLMVACNRQTDRPRPRYVCSNRPHQFALCMQCSRTIRDDRFYRFVHRHITGEWK